MPAPKIVLAQGCFDVLHVAHVRHLEEARQMGDCLVVGLTRDEAVGKGPNRPILPQAERVEMLKALRCVGGVTLCSDAIEAMRHWNPSIFVKGHDRKKIGLLPEEIAYCKANGIEIRFTKPNPQTTTNIVEKIKCAS